MQPNRGFGAKSKLKPRKIHYFSCFPSIVGAFGCFWGSRGGRGRPRETPRDPRRCPTGSQEALPGPPCGAPGGSWGSFWHFWRLLGVILGPPGDSWPLLGLILALPALISALLPASVAHRSAASNHSPLGRRDHRQLERFTARPTDYG